MKILQTIKSSMSYECPNACVITPNRPTEGYDLSFSLASFSAPADLSAEISVPRVLVYSTSARNPLLVLFRKTQCDESSVWDTLNFVLWTVQCLWGFGTSSAWFCSKVEPVRISIASMVSVSLTDTQTQSLLGSTSLLLN